MEDPHHTLASSTINVALEEVNRILSSNQGWEEFGTTDGVTGFRMPHDSGFQIVKVTGTINRPAEHILEYLWQFTNKRLWDETLNSNRCVKSFSNELRIMYEQTNAPWPVSNRDYVYAQRRMPIENGFLLVGKSVEIGEPHVKGVERAEVIYNYSRLIRQGDNVTQITVGGCIDPKGSLPKSLTNKMSKKQVDRVISLRKALG